MNTTITSNGLPLPPQTKSSQGSGTQQGASTSTEGASATAGAGSDSLKLTASAQSLQDVAKAGSGQQVNTQRVEQIRQSLANGTYQINPGHIADRLISIEGQLSSKS